MQSRPQFADLDLKRLVVKLGTGILTSGIGQLDLDIIRNICAQIAEIRRKGIQVIVVSSGAVGLGMGRLGFKRRPSDLSTLQALASVGQSILIETWRQAFETHGVHVGQMLLTRDDLSVKRRHVMVRDTLERLLQADIVPIINENDCISVDELKFGDNDILSALVSSLTKANLLVLLSTIPGLMNLESGEVLPTVTELTDDILALAQGTTSPTAVGGMVSKLNAAKIVTSSQCGMFIAPGKEEDILLKLLGGEPKGTFFVPGGRGIRSHKRWLAFFNRSSGTVQIDAGASRALREEGKSLLAKGVTSVGGSFKEGAVIEVIDLSGQRIARGITQYDSLALTIIQGKSSQDIRIHFPDRKHVEVIHRDALALIH